MALEVIISMVSTLYERTGFWPLQRHINWAGDFGFPGIEFHPTRLAMWEIRKQPRRIWKGIRTVHHSVRSEHNLWDILHHHRSATDATLSMILFEEMNDSFWDLCRLKTGQDRTVLVHFPESKSSPLDPRLRYGPWDFGFQPKADLAHAWGAKTWEEFAAISEARGYKWVLDLHHIRRVIKDRKNPNVTYRLPNWQQLLLNNEGVKLVRRMVRLVHIGPGRPDNELPGVNGPVELASIIRYGQGGPRSELVDMLESLAAIGHDCPIVIETPARAIARYLGYSKHCDVFMSPEELYKTLREMRQGLERIWTRW